MAVKVRDVDLTNALIWIEAQCVAAKSRTLPSDSVLAITTTEELSALHWRNLMRFEPGGFALTFPWVSFGRRKYIARAVREAVLSGASCVTCGTPEALTLDHIVPWSRGGSDDIANLQPMCRSCNSRKGARVA